SSYEASKVKKHVSRAYGGSMCANWDVIKQVFLTQRQKIIVKVLKARNVRRHLDWTERWTQRSPQLGTKTPKPRRGLGPDWIKGRRRCKTSPASYGLSQAPPTVTALSNGNPKSVRHRPSVGPEARGRGPQFGCAAKRSCEGVSQIRGPGT
ncbi:60S ribosomal protein L34, partial [Galemys pyrenaicus]